MLWQYRDLIVELTKREFSGRYQGSFGGIMWSFIQPLFLLTIYTLAFGVILKTRWSFSGSTGVYALMLFLGLIIFNAFSECLLNSTKLITKNPNFVKKIVFPLELLPIITVLTNLLHACIAIAVWIAGYFLFFGSIRPTVILFAVVLLCFAPILLGLGWLLAALGVIIRDISHATTMLNHTLLFLTPIFYSVEAAPTRIQKLLLLNPLTFIIEQFRKIMFLGQLPDFAGLGIYFGCAVLFACISLGFFRWLRPNFADMV